MPFTLTRIHRPAALAACILLVGLAQARAQRRHPVPSSDREQGLLNEGNALHDNQDFDGAIAKYHEVLALNPDNVDALFELATCHYDKAEFKKSLETALRGAEYQSDNLGYFYILIGTCYDELGLPAKAIEAYREGIKAEPNSYLLHYNIAVTYLTLKRVDEARESFKRALLLNPNHASSHIGLGQIYIASGYRVPALLAFCRALVLEPGSGRSESAVKIVEQLLGAALPTPKASTRRDEGNFEQTEKLLATVGSIGAGKGDEGEIAALAERLRYLLGPFATTDPRKLGGGFAAAYYAPYFAEISRRNYVEPMAYHIFQSIPREGVADWLRGNAEKVNTFLAWSKGYTWRDRRP